MRFVSVAAVRAIIAIAMLASIAAAAAQEAPKPRTYKPVAIELPLPVKDPSFVAFRKQVGDIAKRKDRAALAKVVASNFFWSIDDGTDVTDKARSGADNLARALYLDNAETEGWDILAAFAAEATADPLTQRKGVICGPGEPKYDGAAVTELGKSTGTTSAAWYFPVNDGIPVRDGLAPSSPVIGKLGMHLIWIYPDDSPEGAASAEMVRIILPSGKFGYVPSDALLPLPGDLLCYAKDGNAWKIAGYVGGLPPAK
jgi:hypothetical protein